VNLKTRIDLIDYDYINKLSEAEKKWLNQFTEEYTIASFKSKRNIIKDRKDSYNRNNARNRCIYTRSKASGYLDYLEDLKLNENEMIEDQESLMNDIIDNLESEDLHDTGNDTNDNGETADET
jgi:hypothetical protein